MEIENVDQVGFAIKHGINTTNRMVPDLLNAVKESLEKHGIEYNGHKIIKQLGEVKERDGEWSLLFDVKNPDSTFDHIEFKVTKTGWGRSL